MQNLFISNLHIVQFKNIENLQLNFSNKITFIIGKNGSGKTSILDSIHTLLCGKSHFINLEKYLIQYQQSFYKLSCTISNLEKQYKIQCLSQVQQRKKFFLNDVIYDKISEHIGKFPCVIIAPEDINLVNEGSEMRRSFLDFTIAQHDTEYLQHLMQYNAVLHQRNALLKILQNQTIDTNLIATYNTIVSNLSGFIFEKRKKFFEHFEPLFLKYYKTISDASESVEITYQSQLQKNNLIDLLEQNLQKDIVTQRTNFGIHKDDFNMNIESNDARKVASQGQKKSILIALKLAQYFYIYQQSGKKAILLLDDIFEKIDEKRAQKLFQIISTDDFEQIFVSDCYENRFHSEKTNIPSGIFKIENGVLQ